MQDLLRRPLVPLEFTEQNKKVALINELLIDKNNFVYIKRADGSFPSIQDIIIEYLGGSMVFRGFVNTRADLDDIDINSRTIGDMYIVRVDETYKDPEDNKNIEYIVMEDTIEGEKVRYWECLGNPFVRGIDEEFPIYGSTKLITSGAIYKYGFNFVTNIEVDNDEDVFIFTKGFETSPDGTLRPIKETIGTDRHRKVETRPDTKTVKYLTGTSHNSTANDVLLFDSGVYIGTTAGELNSTSFNTKSIVVFSSMDNDNTKVKISPTAVIVGSGIPTTLEKSNLNVGKLSSGYRFSIVDNTVSIKDSAVSLSNISQLDISTTGNINITGTNINLTGNLNLNKIKIVNTDIFTKDNADLQLNYNIGGVKIGKDQTESKLLGYYTFGEDSSTKASKIDLYGLFTVRPITGSSKTSSIYDILSINYDSTTDSGVRISPIASNGNTKETAIFSYDYTRFTNDIEIYGSNNSIYLKNNSGNTTLSIDSTNITIFSSNRLQYLSLSNDNISSTAPKFTISNSKGSIVIGNSKSDNISLGYLSNEGSIFDSSSSATINLNGKVVLRDTTTVDPTLTNDIDDLYGYLVELKKSWSEGLKSLNSALTIVTTGGLDDDTEASNITDLYNKIRYLRPISKQSSDNSNIFYSTINGSNYRRSNISLSIGNKEIKATMSNQLTKNDMTTYTAETTTAYTFEWKLNRLCYKTVEESTYNANNYIESINAYAGGYSIDANIDSDKTIIPAGRYNIPNDIVIKSIGNTHTLRESVEFLGDNYCNISNNALYIDIPFGLYYKGVENSNNNYSMGLVNINNIPISGNNDTFGDAEAAHVLKDKTFTSGATGRLATGTMPNNYSMGNKKLYCGETFTIPEGYHTGHSTVTAYSLAYQTSATATAADILKDKTAWVDGEKISGTMNKLGNYRYHPDAYMGVVNTDSYTDDTGTKTALSGTTKFLVVNENTTGYISSEANKHMMLLSRFGDAEASHVLSGKTFTSKDGFGGATSSPLTGTMPDNSSLINQKINCSETFTIPEGYHTGNVTVTANSLLSQTPGTATDAKILDGYTAWVYGEQRTGNIISFQDNRYVPDVNIAIRRGRTSYTDNTGKEVSLSTPTDFLSIYEGGVGYVRSANQEIMVLLSRFGDAETGNVAYGKTFTSTTGICSTGSMKSIYTYGRVLADVNNYYPQEGFTYGTSFTKNYNWTVSTGHGVIILFKVSTESASGYPLHAIGGTIGNTVVYGTLSFDLGNSSMTVHNNGTDVTWIQVNLLTFGDYYSEWW